MSLPFMDIFKSWASDYDATVSGNNDEYKDVFSNYPFMLEQVADCCHGHVTEFGPGTGNLTALLLSRGLEVNAVEPSPEMRALGEEKTGLTFIDGDFLNHPVQNTDTIVSSFAFHHLTDEEKSVALSQFYNMLHEDGNVIILDTVFNSSEQKEEMKAHYASLGYSNLVKDLNREYYPLKSTMKDISERNGFEYESRQMNHFAHLQILKKKKYPTPADLLGNTPLVELPGVLHNDNRLFVKLESYNPGGSVKDRLGKYMIESALKRGDINKTVVEATAGNTGIGLALACLEHHLDLIVFVPEQFSQEKQQIMKALGAKIIHTPSDKGMLYAREQAEHYANSHDAYYINQFMNDDNPASYETLAREIDESLPVTDVVVAGAGSGGTFTGLARYFKDAYKVIVEPEGSILNGGASGSHRTEGIGVEEWPAFLDKAIIDDIQTIPDIDAFTQVSRIAQQFGLLIGSSSGAALQAAINVSERFNHKNFVVIFPDAAERYLSKSIFDIKGEQSQ